MDENIQMTSAVFAPGTANINALAASGGPAEINSLLVAANNTFTPISDPDTVASPQKPVQK